MARSHKGDPGHETTSRARRRRNAGPGDRAHRATASSALLRRQPSRAANQPGGRRRLRGHVAERQGVRRHLLGGELLLRCRPRRDRRAEPRRAPRTSRPTTPGSRSSTTTARSIPARWIGVQNPGDQRNNLSPPLVLNEPYGSDIANGVLYLADRDGGTNPNEPSVAVIRRFNLQTGAPAGEISRREVSLAQRPRGRRRRDDLCDANRSRWRQARSGQLAGMEDRARRHAVDLHPGRAAPAAERHRLRSRRATSSSSTSATTKC